LSDGISTRPKPDAKIQQISHPPKFFFHTNQKKEGRWLFFFPCIGFSDIHFFTLHTTLHFLLS